MTEHWDKTKVTEFSEEVNVFENALEEELWEEGRKRMKEKLEECDRVAAERLRQQVGYRSRGVVRRKVMTRFGEIELSIHRYRGVEGAEVYPLERCYGIGRITEGARRRAMRFVVERSYAWSASVLREECGIGLSRMRLWKLVQEEGTKEQRRIEQLQEKIFEEGDDRQEPDRDERSAVVEIDGTMIATRDAVKMDEYGKKRMEVKVGVMFRGTEMMSRKRRRTVKRKVFAQVAEGAEFGERLYAVFREHGLSSEEPVQVVADGAMWIRNLRSAVFPRGRYTLDLYHLKERASRVLMEYQQEQFFERVCRGKATDGLVYLRTLRGSDRRHKRELEEFIHYVEENLSGMQYTPGAIHGSGVVEKLSDLLVKKRMKRQGMTWSRRGANNLLALRSVHLNNLEHRGHRTVKPKASQPLADKTYFPLHRT